MKIKVTCQHCGYQWESKTKLLHPTCPNCRRKTKINLEFNADIIDSKPKVELHGDDNTKSPDASNSIKINKCLRCRHHWVQRNVEIPRICPFCKSAYWNVQKKEVKNGGKRD